MVRSEERNHGQGRLAWAGRADDLSEPSQRWTSMKDGQNKASSDL